MTTNHPVPAVPVLAMEHIYKTFGGVHALTDASFEVRPGEVHALLGENGAGKSTLVKIVAGVHERDEGTVRWQGDPVEIRSFNDAERLGIHVIYQQLNVLDHLSVAENITLGRERIRMSFVDIGEERRRAASALAALGVEIDFDARAGNLRVAEKQLVEIARALWGDVRLLIMDEPTSSLGEREVDRLFEIIERLREQGISVVYISHKLEEVFRIADRITVLRDGHTVGTVATGETNQDDLIAMMVGRRLGHAIEKTSHATDQVVLEVVSLGTDTGLSGVSFSLRQGEVLGVYGLLGSGRTELARALFGADPLREGFIRVNGEGVRFGSPADAKRRGLGLATEERAEASFPFLTIRENLTAPSWDRIAPGGWLRPGKERSLAQKMVDALRIRTPSANEPLSRLSGGNQQKVVVGRWLLRDVPILIMDDPTSGIDVGAKDELYHLIGEMTAVGTSVIMTSSELPELLALSDRMIVLHHGRVVGILEADALTEENVIRMAVAGVGPKDLATGSLEQPAAAATAAVGADPDA
jgi:ribose transport system ATP-binding protein